MAVAPRVNLAPDHLDAVPGQPVAFDIEVFNPAEIIEGYEVKLRGLPPEAVTAVPADLSLFPEETGSMTITIVLPATFPAGRHSIPLRVEAATDPTIAWSGALALNVAAVPAAELRVDPSAVTGGRHVETRAVVTNLGNNRRDFVLTAADAERATLVDMAPSRLSLSPGATATSLVMMHAGRHWFGSPILRLVTVTATDELATLEAPVAYTQKALIPRTLITALAVLALLALWAGILLFGLGQVVEANRPPTTEPVTVPAGSISGHVTADDPRLLPGIAVEAFEESDTTAVIGAAATDADGAYLITDLPAGSYFVRFSAEGRTDYWYAGSPTPLGATAVPLAPTRIRLFGRVLGGTARNVDARLDLPGNVSGRVADAAGGGISQYVVAASLADAEPDVPPVARRQVGPPLFALTELPSPAVYEVTVAKVGFADAVVRVPLFAGEAVDLGDVVLREGPGTISGLVTDAAGRPLPGIAVSVTDGATEAATVTDGAGAFVIGGLHAPRSYKLGFADASYQPQTVVVEVAPDGPTDDVAVVLAGTAGTIFGSVWGGDGGVGDVTVTIAGPEAMVATTTSTEKETLGEFFVTGLPTPGTYTVTFEKDGLKPTIVIVELAAGAPPAEVVVEPEVDVAAAIAAGEAEPGAIFGVVTDAAGVPLTGVAVTITDGSDEVATTTSDAPPGRYEVAGFETAGTFTVTFAAEGFTTRRILTELDVGQRLELNASLEREGPLRVADLVLSVDGIGPFPFGTPGAEVVAALDETFGTGAVVTGPAGVCPGVAVRYVRYGALLVMLRAGDDGTETLVGYRVDVLGSPTPADALATVSGLAIRQTVAELDARFAGSGIEVRKLTRDGATIYELRRISDDALLLWGPLSATDATGTVLGIYAPDPCAGG